jgi:hypothetical protein
MSEKTPRTETGHDVEDVDKALEAIADALQNPPQNIGELLAILKPHAGLTTVANMIKTIEKAVKTGKNTHFDKIKDPDERFGLKTMVKALYEKQKSENPPLDADALEKVTTELKLGSITDPVEEVKLEGEATAKLEGDFLDRPQSHIRNFLQRASRDKHFSEIHGDIDLLVGIFNLRVAVATQFDGVENIDPTKLSTRQKRAFELGPIQTKYVKDIIAYYESGQPADDEKEILAPVGGRLEGDFLDRPQSQIRDFLEKARRDSHFTRIHEDVGLLIKIFDKRYAVAKRFDGVEKIDPTQLSTNEEKAFNLDPQQTKYVKDIITYYESGQPEEEEQAPQKPVAEGDNGQQVDAPVNQTTEKPRSPQPDAENLNNGNDTAGLELQKKKDRIKELENARKEWKGDLYDFYVDDTELLKLKAEVAELEKQKAKEGGASPESEKDEKDNTDPGKESEKKPKKEAKKKAKTEVPPVPNVVTDEKEKNRNSDELPIIDAEFTDIKPETEAKKEEEPISLKELIEKVRNGEKQELWNNNPNQDKKELWDQRIKEQEPKKKRQLGAVQTDLMEKRAREIAAERMTANKNELRGFGGFLTKIWKHNWMAEYYRAKEIKRVRAEMMEVGSTLGEGDEGGRGDSRIKSAILERFLKDTPGLIHEAAGEWKNDLDQIKPEQKAEAESAIREAIVAYVSNSDVALAEGNLTEAINQTYANIFTDKEGNNSFEPLNIADNIKEYAREMRGQVEHGTAIAKLDLDFELTFGKANTGARTEEAYTWRDKLIQKMAKSPVGRFVNETTIAAAVCAAAAVVTRTAQWTTRLTLGVFGGGMVAGGALAAIRESQAVKRDRAEHARAMATGKTFNEENSPRRKEINETNYEMIQVRNAIDNLRVISQDIESSEDPRDAEAKLRDLMGFIGGIDARINLSDTEKIDLLSYSNPQDVEIERTELDIARAEAKVFARQTYEKLGLKQKLGDFDRMLDSAESAQGGVIIKDLDAKDETFKALKRRRMMKHALGGATMAGAAGWIFREAMHSVHSLKDLINNDMSTPSESVSMAGTTETFNAVDTHGVPHEITTTHAGSFKVPEGFHIVQGDNPEEYTVIKGGRFSVSGELVGGKVVAEHIEFDKAPGTNALSSESVETLNKAGFSFINNPQSSTTVSDFTIEQTKNLTPQEYAAAHSQEFERSHRMGWASKSLNEHRLSDPVMGKDGKIHISLKGMTQNGSVMGNRHINVPSMIKNGKVELWISASQDTQFTPAHIQVGPDGVAIIDPNSAVGKLFKFDSHGHIIERPRFTEAAAIMGSHNGVKDAVICATDVGKGYHHISSGVDVHGVRETVTSNVETELTYTEQYPEGPDGPIIPIPFFTSRTPLESTEAAEEQQKRLRGPKETLLLEDKGTEVSTNGSYFEKEIDGKRVWVDKEGNPIKRNLERENKNIKDYLEKQEVWRKRDLESAEKMIAPMNEKCRVAINIPARNEEKNLTNLLDQYVKQVDKEGKPVDPDLFEINILVNRGEGEKPDKSVEVLNTWKKMNPKFRVNVLDVPIPLTKANSNIGYVRKFLNDLTVQRSVNRPKSDGPLYIENETADLLAVDKRIVSKLIKDFDAEPHIDVLRGMQDIQPEVLKKNDLLFFSSRLKDFTEMAVRKMDSYRPMSKQSKDYYYDRAFNRGSSMAFTAEAYAEAGGFMSAPFGGGAEIVQKIARLRGTKDSKTGEITPNRKTTKASGLRSTRKFADTVNKRASVKGAKSETEILDYIKEYAEITSEQKQSYQDSIDRMVRDVKWRVGEEQAPKAVSRVLWAMGLKEKAGHYTINNEGEVNLTDKGMSEIIDLLVDYNTNNKHRFGRKSTWGYRRQNTPVGVR